MAWLYRNAERPTEERLDDLLARMNLDEKLAQLRAIELDAEKPLEVQLANGIASVSGLAQTGALTEDEYRRRVTEIQHCLSEDTRLGIPALICEPLVDVLELVSQCPFPPPLAQAATFNPELVQELATRQRERLRALGVRQLHGPLLDVVRDPRWPELLQTFGEDPYLVGRMGVACIRGLQGEGLGAGVLASAGRFLAGALVEGGRRFTAVEMGRRQLREVVAEPFAAAIREAGLQSVIAADTTVDGLACSGSAEILDTLLRGELGFRGIVCAERFALERMVTEHRVAADRSEAAVHALAAGVDLELPGGECFGLPLEEALDRGRISEDALDRAVRRVLKQKFELGLFESAQPVADAAEFPIDEQQALARRLAEQSVVLLKNETLLPLAQQTRIALLGPGTAVPVLPVDADRPPQSAASTDSTQTLQQALAEGYQLTYAEGCTAAVDAVLDSLSVAETLAQADLAVVCLTQTVGADLPDLLLPVAQQQLLQQVAASDRPMVLVLCGTAVFSAAQYVPLAAAALVAWCPEKQFGCVVADTLSGVLNPSGRLPVSIGSSIGGLPVHYNQRSSNSADTDSRCYGFGHGLSYSRFDYGDPGCVGTVDSHGAVELSVTVENSSEIAGTEVVQLYMHDPVADVTRPRRQLIGFQRVSLAAGQKVKIEFHLDVSLFAYYNREMEYVVDTGMIELLVGSSSTDIKGRCQLMVEGERRTFKQQQRLATQSQVHDADA